MSTNPDAIVRVPAVPNRGLSPADIASEQSVIHPALDWHENTLLMGINGGSGVLTSDRQLIPLAQLPWPICDQAGSFSRSPVTRGVAERFLNNYGMSGTPDAYALVSAPSRLAAYYRRFVIFDTNWWPEVLALWTLGTYVYPIFSAYPYLRITSPEPGCGKSVLGQIISNLAFNAEFMVCPTEANIFRLAESERGTQVWDEMENESGIDQSRFEAMRAALLNGYRSGAAVPRQQRVGGNFVTTRFHLYVPRVLIGLSSLSEVVRQRTIELLLHRRTADQPCERYHYDELRVEENELREMCALYALSYCRAISQRYRNPNLAQQLESRVGQAGRLTDDLLLPLFAVGFGALDDAPRSREVVMPMLRTLALSAVPAIAQQWNESATTTPPWLSAALDILERAEITPRECAERVRNQTGVNFTPERMAQALKRYGIRTDKRNGVRRYHISPEQIGLIRSRYVARSEEAEDTPAETSRPSTASSEPG